MPNLTDRRPSPSMLVAIAALVVACTGTAAAMSKLVKGDKLIAKHSLSGNRLRDHTLTGSQINMKRLGMVPSALNATSATKAKSATTASNLNGTVTVTPFTSLELPSTADGQIVAVGGLKIFGGCNATGKVDLFAQDSDNGALFEISDVSGSAGARQLSPVEGRKRPTEHRAEREPRNRHRQLHQQLRRPQPPVRGLSGGVERTARGSVSD